MGTLESMATPPHTASSRRPDALTLEVVELIGSVVARYHEEYEEAVVPVHSLTFGSRHVGTSVASAADRGQ